jgi:orotidine-5'-phosphate decarboxylase
MNFQLAEVCTPGSKRERKLYEEVILHAMKWGTADQLMFVIGATHPELFRNIRKMAPENFFLVPGVGAQGGNLRDITQAGINNECGLIVNSSRQIIFASEGEDFAEKARAEAKKIQAEMENLLNSLI